MFPARFIFGVLCIIQVQRVDFTNQEGFNTGLVTLLCYSVRFFGYCQLLCLVIEMLYQQENILLKLICSCRIFESTTSRLLFATRTFPRLFPQSRIGI